MPRFLNNDAQLALKFCTALKKIASTGPWICCLKMSSWPGWSGIKTNEMFYSKNFGGHIVDQFWSGVDAHAVPPELLHELICKKKIHKKDQVSQLKSTE